MPRLAKSRIIHSGDYEVIYAYVIRATAIQCTIAECRMDGRFLNVTEGQELDIRVVGLYGSQTRYQIGWFLVLLNHDNETTIMTSLIIRPGGPL